MSDGCLLVFALELNIMFSQGEGNQNIDGEDDLYRFVLRFRPTVIAINVVFGMVFVALKIWPLVVLYLLVATLHFCMMRWDSVHANHLAASAPWMWFVYLFQFLVSVIVVGPGPGFQFYMIATIPALFSTSQWPLAAKNFQTSLIALLCIASDAVFSTWTPIYPLHARTSDLLRELNIIGVCATTAVVSYLLYLTVKQAETRLKNLASTDALTGLLNRRRMTESIDKEFAHCKRVFRPLSLIICDIDRFKLINDRYGHDVGDKVLKGVGKVFSSLRDYDSVARWGGEEFIVLLPDTDHSIAMKVAERLRAGVAASVIAVGDAPIPVTMTFGVAQINPGETWQSALVRADQALYSGKECGRNRVMASAAA